MLNKDEAEKILEGITIVEGCYVGYKCEEVDNLIDEIYNSDELTLHQILDKLGLNTGSSIIDIEKATESLKDFGFQLSVYEIVKEIINKDNR